MLKVRTTEVPSRLGKFTVIKLGQTVLISQCDTRMKVLEALSRGACTGEQLARKIRVSYSAVMDHLEFLEKIGVVKATLRREEGKSRRIIYFHLNEDPLEGIEALFMTARNGKARV